MNAILAGGKKQKRTKHKPKGNFTYNVYCHEFTIVALMLYACDTIIRM